MSTLKAVSFCDDLITVYEYEQVDLPSSPTTETSISITPGSVPPPPPSLTLPTVQQHSTSLMTLPPPPSSDDLEQIMKKLKKPTQQHIVDFRERYEMALKRDQEKN